MQKSSLFARRPRNPDADAESIVLEDPDILSRPGMQTLAEILKPLSLHYEHPNVEEMIICSPGKVFFRLREKNAHGQIWEERSDPALSMEYLDIVLHAVSNIFSISFDGAKHPLVTATLPGRHRFTAIRGQAVVYDEQTAEGGVVICIRTGAKEGFVHKLEDWGLDESTPLEGTGREQTQDQFDFDTSKSLKETILEAAQRGLPIMLSGSTGTGKTSILRVLLNGISRNLRVVTVEDVREIIINQHPNRTHLMMDRNAEDGTSSERGLSAKQIVDSVVRITPDVLVLSEISTQNATLAVELLMTGHSHFWTTIHAGSTEEAFKAFAQRTKHGNSNQDSEEIIGILKERMIVLQLEDYHGHRKLTETYWPQVKSSVEEPERNAGE